MKRHIILKLDRPLDRLLPYWQDCIGQRPADIRQGFTAGVDAVMQSYGIPFLATAEYRQQGTQWSESEIASGLDRIYRLVLLQNREIPAALIPALEAVPGVAYARNGDIGAGSLPEPRATALSSPISHRSRRQIYLDEAHLFTKGEPSVTVAVLDTGVDLEHEELQGAIGKGFDFVNILQGADEFIGDYLEADPVPDDEVGHGTHVAGIIAARGLRMPPGVAPRCRIMPVRVLAAVRSGDQIVGAGLVDNINNGIKWAVDNGAQVINMSLGVLHEGGGLPHEEVVRYALAKNVTIVAASGNDGTRELYYPGALPGVLAVGAVDEQGEVAGFSSFGQQVSFAAPGVDIYSTFNGNGYAYSSGTSHAAPFVSGGVALLHAYARKHGFALTDAQIKHVLKLTSDKNTPQFKDEKTGYGTLNLVDALRLLDYKLRKQF